MLRNSEVPRDMTVMSHIAKSTGWSELTRSVGDRFVPQLSLPGLHVDYGAMGCELAAFYREVGCVEWRSQPNPNIHGASLSINPDHDAKDWIHASFGHPRYQVESKSGYYAAVEADIANRVKGDYLDSLGFRRLHPSLYRYCPTIVALLESFSVPVVRVTARTILGHRCAPSANANNTGGFHTDDSPFEVLRVNVAIDNDGSFGLEYEDGSVVRMTSGANAVVNSDVRHRVHLSRPTLRARTHLVIGLAPWLKYDQRADAWMLNEHAGVTHPYDMAKMGLLTKR